MLIGHERVFAQFLSFIERDSLAQAYTLVGPGGVGKRTIATLLAATILKTTPEKLVSHPDFFTLDRGVDEKTGKPKSEISVASARALRAKLAEKSWSGGFRVVIVDEAEYLSIEAGNALLKTVEEPTDKTVMFFLVPERSALLATIVSRTAVYYVTPVDAATIAKGLVERGVDPEVASNAAERSWGLPGRALRLASDEEMSRSVGESSLQANKLLYGTIPERLSTIEMLTEKKESSRTADDVGAAIDEWIMTYRTHLPETNTLMQALLNAKRQLAENVNPRLLLESIFISL